MMSKRDNMEIPETWTTKSEPITTPESLQQIDLDKKLMLDTHKTYKGQHLPLKNILQIETPTVTSVW